MRMKKLLVVIAALTLAASVVFLAACGGGSSRTNSRAVSMGTVNTSFSDPPTCASPAGPYSHVFVTIRDVRVHQGAAAPATDAGWVDLAPGLSSSPKQIDLLGAANTQCFLAQLGAQQIQAGSYQQIRVILLANNMASQVSGNQCGSSAANCVVLAADSSVHTLQLSSEAQTGIKIPSGQIAGGRFTVPAGGTVDLNIDFDACASIVVQPNGQFRLKPVLHAGEVSLNTSSISGKLVDSVTQQPIAGGTAIVALEQKDAGGVDRVILQTKADGSGNFTFCPVPTGTYDVVAAAVNGAGVAYAATVTTGVAQGTAMGNIPMVAETGANTSQGSITGQVTTAGASGGTAADITLSALEAITGGTLVTVPLVQQMSATATLATAADASCPAGTDCASYTLAVPAANPNVGAFNSGGTTYTQDTVNPVKYTVDALAFVPSSGGTADCSPSEMQANTLSGGGNLVVTAGGTATAATIAFTGCQ